MYVLQLRVIWGPVKEISCIITIRRTLFHIKSPLFNISLDGGGLLTPPLPSLPSTLHFHLQLSPLPLLQLLTYANNGRPGSHADARTVGLDAVGYGGGLYVVLSEE